MINSASISGFTNTEYLTPTLMEYPDGNALFVWTFVTGTVARYTISVVHYYRSNRVQWLLAHNHCAFRAVRLVFIVIRVYISFETASVTYADYAQTMAYSTIGIRTSEDSHNYLIRTHYLCFNPLP